jgi:choline transport protein
MKNSIPINAALAMCVIPFLVSFLDLKSSGILSDVVSMSVGGFYFSYLAPATLLLYRRSKGEIVRKPRAQSFQTRTLNLTSTLEEPLAWGPWRMSPLLGLLNNIFSVIWMIYVMFFSFFPTSTPTTAEDMNYSVVVTSVAILSAAVYCILFARKTFMGPLMEIEISF